MLITALYIVSILLIITITDKLTRVRGPVKGAHYCNLKIAGSSHATTPKINLFASK